MSKDEYKRALVDLLRKLSSARTESERARLTAAIDSTHSHLERIIVATEFELARKDVQLSQMMTRGSRTPRISLPPGTLMGRVLGSFMTKRAYRLWVYPQIAELQAEYFEELAAGNHWRARYVWARGLVFLLPGWVWGLAARTVRNWFTSS